MIDGRWSGIGGAWRVGLLGLILAASPGCPSSSDDGGEAPEAGGDVADAGGDGAPGAPAEATQTPVSQLTAEQLRPVIREAGSQGAVPTTIRVEFPREIFADLVSDVGWRQEIDVTAPAGMTLSLSPAVDGRLAVTSASSLTFTPQKELSPATRYTATLDAVKVGDRLLTAPAGGAWTHAFTTPRFAFTRMGVGAVDPKGGSALLELVFTYAVNHQQLRDFASFTLDGNPITPSAITASSDPRVARVTLKHPRLKSASATVGLTLKAGMPMANDRSLGAPSATASVEVERGAPMTILALRRMEADGGHYLDVICRDDAAPGGSRWYWDDQNYDSYQISSRCQLTEADAEESIHIEPALSFYVAPSDAGFRIFGDFSRGTYSLRIDAGASTIDGGVLGSTFERTVSVPSRSPRVSFVSKGRYLPRSAWGNLAFTHLNVDEVELTVRHVPVENLLFWMSGSSEAADGRTSNVVLKKKIPVTGQEDQEGTSWVDVGQLLPSPKRGVYELELTGRDKTDKARLLLTDMNLIVKGAAPAKGGAWSRAFDAWAVDMDSTAALGGVKLKLVRMSGQEMASCTTGASGGCRLEVPAKDVDPSGPFAIIATQGEDLTYLKFNDLRTPIAEDEVQGEPYLSEKPYRASLYSDRGVYRPGETAHIAAILRDARSRAPGADMPVTMQVRDPRGRVLKKLELRTNAAGMIAADIPFQDYADTGRYEANLIIGGKDGGTYRFNVEEFVPERMKVEVSAVQEAWLAGEAARFNVDARYLFGGSASGSPVEVNCFLEPSTFKPPQNGQYNYNAWRDEKEDKRLTLGAVTATLNEDGHAEVACPASSSGGLAGPARVVAEVAVFEAGSGRTTRGQASAAVHPERYYVGLSTNLTKAKSGEPIPVEGIVVDWQGRVVADALTEVQLRYFRMEAEYSWYWDDDWGEETFQRQLRAVPEGKGRATVSGGRFKVTVTPGSAGDGFLIRALAGAAQTDLTLEGEPRYWWGPSESRVDQTPRPMKPTALTLKVEGAARVGQATTVRFDAPYRGRVLMTAETDHLLASQWLDVQAGPVEWSFTPDKFVPNVYLSALLIKDPHLDSEVAYKPDRGFGVTSVKVEPVEFTYDLKMKVPAEIRSNSKLTVDLDVGKLDGPTFVTVAAVDEGILSLTRFEDPDPFKAIFARRALGVETFETIGWTLLVPPGGPSKAHGGGEGGDPGRVQPVKPVALWSGIVEVPKGGKVQVSFDVPQYRGSLRVMAVAAGEARMGKAAASVPVRDPLVLQTTLPRFLIDGDEIQIPVFVTNMSGAPRDISIRLATEDIPLPGVTDVVDPVAPLQMLGAREGSISLAAGEAGTVVFQARARKTVGAARLKVEARSGELVSYEELEVPFSPNGPRTRKVQRIELTEGKTDVTPYLTGWVPTTERSTLWVTANPYGDAFDHLKHLIHYPYGCIEQTTSSTRPLLYVSNLLYNVDPSLLAGTTVDRMVAAGIDRVMSMQTSEGGFAYWPGGSDPTWWGTAYATHLLLDAKRLGHPVSPVGLDSALAWIEGQLTNRPDSGGSYYWGSFNRAEAYLHYVLALAGKGRKARIQQLIDGAAPKPTGQAAEELYMLKAALYLTGDHRYEADLKAPDVSDLTGERKNYWNFYSDLRRRGFVLNVFQDLFEGDPAGQPLADLVARGLAARRSSWYSTQELVWGVTGLGRWVTVSGGSFDPPELSANGKDRDAQPVPKEQKTSDRTWELARASEYRQLSVEVDDVKAEHVYLMLMSEGVREDSPWTYGGNGLSISRTFRDLEGNELDPASLNLGDLVYVDLRLSNSSGEEIQNVALVDRLPAGWEIENPRLGRGGSVEWVDESDLWSPDYMNLRDDRVEVFGKVGRRTSVRVVYAARAVTSGRFTLPPVEAEAMYEPTLWAREAGGIVEIAGPWGPYLL